MPSMGLTRVRIWVVGFGTVGTWLVRALDERAEELGRRHRLAFDLVGLANRRDGFVHSEAGIDKRAALELAGDGAPLTSLPGVRHWPTALDGLRATEADVLVEVTESPATSGEPGHAHLSEALARGIPAVTSNKWPVALRGLELVELARSNRTALRAEATVMSGTPVLRALTDGLAGATPQAARGVLNATANFIASTMAGGRGYADALAEAQRAGLAERDPRADVDGHDSVAKLMILAGLVFGEQLDPADVARRGISSAGEAEFREAAATGARVRELATLERSAGGSLRARVEPAALSAVDRLAHVDGTDNAIVCRAEPLGEVTVIGPGAGLGLAGLGVLSDLIDVARR